MEQNKHERHIRRALRRVFRRVIFPILAVLTAVFLYYFLTSLSLSVEYYTVQANVVSPFRIVQLSDLHNAQFGKRNKKLVELVSLQHPDLIVMSGDMLNSSEDRTDIITALISDLRTIAPVYYGYGNHETGWEKRTGRSLRPLLESAGAFVVDNDYLDLEFKGSPLRIGGYSGYFPVPFMTPSNMEQQALERAFCEEYLDTDRVKILINHIPTSWVYWDYVNKYPVDLVFSGHFHGGVMRIPVLDQGLYAPYVGWFPSFSKGLFPGTKAVCVLSAGLGNERLIPRVNNPPEIVVVDLVPSHED